jgi:hypothetical protein
LPTPGAPVVIKAHAAQQSLSRSITLAIGFDVFTARDSGDHFSRVRPGLRTASAPLLLMAKLI